MGQQYNKVLKRRRRAAYNDRKNEGAKAVQKPGRAKAAKPAPKKPEAAPAESAA